MSIAALLFRPCIRICAAVVAVGALLCGAQGEEVKHPAKPFLWKVEKAELAKPSYLFGTIHLGTGPVARLHPAAEAAFTEAKALHVETAMSVESQLGAMEFLTRKDGKTLTQSIGPELAKALDAQLKEINAELGIEPFETFKTWHIAVMLPFVESQLKGEKILDLQLWERAEREGKKPSGMQTLAEMSAGFDELPEKDQVALLAETVRYFREEKKDMKDSLADIVAAYLTGEPQRLEQVLDKAMRITLGGRHKELGDRLAKRILNDRDVIMADYIDATLKKSPEEVHFFAAGAAHYAPDNGVRGYLEKKGYKITRVE